MKTKFVLLILCVLVVVHHNYSQNVGTAARMHINDIDLPLDNKGKIAEVVVPDGGRTNGFYGEHEFLFSAGFLMGGLINDTIWANGVCGTALLNDYQPGTLGMDPNDPKASLYKVNSLDPPFGQSWQDWTDAVSMGADFYDGDHNGIYDPIDLNNNGVWDVNEDKPGIIGDESFWCVYNDGVPANEKKWGCIPLGIEIRQTMFAYSSAQSLGKVVFIRYRIKNSGLIQDTIKNVYFGNWADADIGEVLGFVYNLTGIDTLRNADYTYLKNPSPQDWGDNPPCFMTDLLTGPLSYIPGVSYEDINGNNIYDIGIDIPIDTAYSFRGPLGVQIFPGALNEKLSSSVYYIGGDPVLLDPRNKSEGYNNLLGLTIAGNIVDPCNWVYGQVSGVPCSEVNPFYWSSGDPVSNLGWISIIEADVRNIQTAGPFNLVKNQEVEILIAYEVGQGDSPLNSVTVAGNISDEIQNYYENNFGYPYVLGVKDKNNVVLNYSLNQNYPNPFNPVTRIRYELPQDGFITIDIFNILGQRVTTLLNKFQKADRYEVEFNGSELASGIYIYRMKVNDFIASKKMVLVK